MNTPVRKIDAWDLIEKLHPFVIHAVVRTHHITGKPIRDLTPADRDELLVLKGQAQLLNFLRETYGLDRMPLEDERYDIDS